MTSPTRMLALVCPDWPATVVAEQLGLLATADPIVVLHANRVISCTDAARSQGVSIGLRKREAQARCALAACVSRDIVAEQRLFEPVVRVLEQLTVGVEIIRPGVCLVGARGPARYLGSERAVMEKVVEATRVVMARSAPSPLVGIADGAAAAELAAYAQACIEPGRTREFLSPLPIQLITEGDLADLLVRLGVRTIGEFAALPAPSVLARFGLLGAHAHQLAQALDHKPIAIREPPTDMAITRELDPPAISAEPVVFAAKQPAVVMAQELINRGLSCRCIEITIETEHGERLVRRWRSSIPITPNVIVERVRWQLAGWLSGTVGVDVDQPTAGVALLRIEPVEVHSEGTYQPAFWGGITAADDRASQGFARVVGLLGPQSVQLPAIDGGRSPEQLVKLNAWADAELSDDQLTTPKRRKKIKPEVVPTWPGVLPAPRPLRLFDSPMTVQVLDQDGNEVSIDSRLELSGLPFAVTMGNKIMELKAWAGPWPIDERWWDRKKQARSARFQCVLQDGSAHVLVRAAGAWTLTASYD